MHQLNNRPDAPQLSFQVLLNYFGVDRQRDDVSEKKHAADFEGFEEVLEVEEGVVALLVFLEGGGFFGWEDAAEVGGGGGDGGGGGRMEGLLLEFVEVLGVAGGAGGLLVGADEDCSLYADNVCVDICAVEFLQTVLGLQICLKLTMPKSLRPIGLLISHQHKRPQLPITITKTHYPKVPSTSIIFSSSNSKLKLVKNSLLKLFKNVVATLLIFTCDSSILGSILVPSTLRIFVSVSYSTGLLILSDFLLYISP
jgi:hypothetical protein